MCCRAGGGGRLSGRAAVELLKAVVEREEIGFGGVRGRKRERVGQAEAGVRGAKLCGASRDVAVDGDDVGADRGQEVVDRLLAATFERVDEDFGVDAGTNDDPVPGGKSWSQEVDGALVLVVGRVQKPDQNVGVERYRRHSSRRPSRYPGG